ncbi:BlaI/MecI/CopY family transcriptional regulator [Acidobacteriia bacterium AH_259_A11_L15]|nr:BlaI/MecI/CopY family transcriptional regulator [Acidobacteriia bacterium AH_259_A11_L15]
MTRPARQTRSSRAKSRVRPYVPRKTIYELPPLELECMKVLWEEGEASVRQIREQLAADHRPLAYTTVETIMDRLTRKGVVERRKVGKAHRYTPVYPKAAARVRAVAALVEHFFEGSRQALRAHLAGAPLPEAHRGRRPAPTLARPKPRPPARPAKREKPPLDTTLL